MVQVRYEIERHALVERLRGAGITSARVLRAFSEIPREAFMPSPLLRPVAYAALPVPIGGGQVLPQPLVLARLLEQAGVAPLDRVLVVGSGSGYLTALAACLARQVVGVECNAHLAKQAAHTLQRIGVTNVMHKEADGCRGWPACAPYDVILVTATASAVPPALLTQLRAGGRLLIPLGVQLSSRAMLMAYARRKLPPQQRYRFVRQPDGLTTEPLELMYATSLIGA